MRLTNPSSRNRGFLLGLVSVMVVLLASNMLPHGLFWKRAFLALLAPPSAASAADLKPNPQAKYV